MSRRATCAGLSLCVARALGHPALLPHLRKLLNGPGGRIGIYQEDKFARFDTPGEPLHLLGLSEGGGWHLVPWADGEGAGLLGVAVLADGEYATSPHRVGLVMFRLEDAGFVRDPDWNAGVLLVTPEPVRMREFDLAEWIAAGRR